jgi:hypothetical protein
VIFLEAVPAVSILSCDCILDDLMIILPCGRLVVFLRWSFDYFDLPGLVLVCLTLSCCVVLCCVVLSCLGLSCRVLSCLVLSCLVLLSFFALPHLALPYSLSCLALPYSLFLTCLPLPSYALSSIFYTCIVNRPIVGNG